MKNWIFLFLVFCHFPAFAAEVVGKWKYQSYIYDGQPYPPSNPDLDLSFEFTDDGISILRWQVKGEPEFCERKALYILNESQEIYQKIVWVHPGNHMSCGSDPDMQLGRESLTPYQMKDAQLNLILQLNGKPYIYIFNKVVEK